MSALIGSIKPEHLQYANNVTHYSLVGFLSAMDIDATHRKYAEELRPIPPSSLGMKMLELSNENFVEDSDPLINYLMRVASAFGDDTETAQSIARRMIQAEKSGIFLWASAKCVATLYAANGYRSPYMPHSWIEQFFNEKKNLPPDSRKQYLLNVVELTQIPLDSELFWTLYHVEQILGFYGVENIILLISAFLEKTEEGIVKEWEKGMSQDVLRELADIDFRGF